MDYSHVRQMIISDAAADMSKSWTDIETVRPDGIQCPRSGF